MSQHLKDFTRHLINEREGAPVSVATIVSVFTNLGNQIEGATPEDQRATARKLLAADEGLAFNREADTIDTPRDGESAEDFTLRHEAGLDSLA